MGSLWAHTGAIGCIVLNLMVGRYPRKIRECSLDPPPPPQNPEYDSELCWATYEQWHSELAELYVVTYLCYYVHVARIQRQLL